MTQLEVLLFPNPILRQPCEDITVFDKRLEKFADDLFETMKSHKGVGLAAPQVGILDRLFVVEYKKRKLVVINPKIISHSGSVVGDEGCLSIPKLNRLVERFEDIKVQAKDINGHDITLEESDFFARIIQHEMDHLNGVLITDKPYIDPDDYEEDD